MCEKFKVNLFAVEKSDLTISAKKYIEASSANVEVGTDYEHTVGSILNGIFLRVRNMILTGWRLFTRKGEEY